MGNAKLKAEELVRKYYTFGLNNPAQSFSWYECKECALIAVEEMLEFTKRTEVSSLTICTPDGCFRDEITYYNDYLIEVKQEIENL